MSTCIFLASDCPLKEHEPSKDYPLVVDVDKGTVYDADADDNFILQIFDDVQSYTDKKYGVTLEWAYYTNGRARKILDYIKDVLKQTDTIEMWHVWLGAHYEYDESPVIRKRKVSFEEITVDDIRELDSRNVLKSSDKRNPDRPTFYCLTINR